jgi:RNA polymerase sigma-70 factor (ECF subfamily)
MPAGVSHTPAGVSHVSGSSTEPSPARRVEAVARIYREEGARVVATLIRLLRDFDLAEDVAQDACAAALEQWPRDGIPDNPHAWLVRTARHKAIDRLRRQRRLQDRQAELEVLAGIDAAALDAEDALSQGPLEDDRLRLVFTCCHPALPLEAQVALTLRTIAGLSTEEIAAAFLVGAPTMAQRLVRAKAKIRDAGIPYRVPEEKELPERLEAVLAVVYLVFTEGYAATSGDVVVRRDLCAQAIRLARLVASLLPQQTEAVGLLALLLLQDSRRDTRVDAAGDIVLLEAQDRARWDRAQIEEGLALVPRALAAFPPGPYALQAAIAALHAQATTAEATDWPQIAALYGVLLRVSPSAIVELNRGVAIAMADGPREGLRALDLLRGGSLDDQHLLHAARADLLARLGRTAEAHAAYDLALALVKNDPERRLLERKKQVL